VPNKEYLQETFGFKEDFFSKEDAFIRENDVRNWIYQDIKKLSAELSKFERIRNFVIKRNPFTIEEGEITPTMKAKRKVIESKYSSSIDEMYTQEAEAE
jgi:long-chain acyl-CoA synthetase